MWVWRWISMVASAHHTHLHTWSPAVPWAGCGGGYTYHCYTGIRVLGYRMAVYTYRDTVTCTLDLNTYHGAVAATWRRYYGSGGPLLHHWLDLHHWGARRRGPGHQLATCVHRWQLWLPTIYGAGLRLVRLAAPGTPCFRPE